MVEGGMTCVKYLLFAFNLVFVIFGILLLYAGFTTIARLSDYQPLIEEAPNNVAITLIIVGFLIFLIAFLGCCGAIRENYCMLVTFSAIILGILIIELIGAGLILAFKYKIKSITEKAFDVAIEKYQNFNNTGSDSPLDKVLDDVQSHLKCCGAIDFNDWSKFNAHYNLTQTLPYSCCSSSNPNDHCIGKNAFDKGCVDKIDDEIRGSFGFLGGIAISVAVIQLVGIIFACCLSKSVKKEYEVV